MAKRKAPQGDQKQIDPTSEAWRALPWRKLEQHTYRIQKRIYRARQHGKQRTVQKLQKLLTKSEAARLIAVRRVTQENQGKKTAGRDGVKSVHPKDRLVMAKHIHPKHWKHQKSKPVRRVWIPKPGKAEKRPLGIPIRAIHYPSFQAMFGIPCVLLLVDQNLRPTFIDLLYHVFALRASSATLPMSLSRLAQFLDDVWGEANPAWAMRMSTDALQNPRVTPIGNGRDIDIEQFGCGQGRVPSIASLSARTESRPLRAGEGNGIGNTNPIDFAGGKAASQPWTQPRFIEQGRDLGRRMGWRPLPHTLDDVWARLAFRSEEHTSELQSRRDLVCRLLLEKKKKNRYHTNCEKKKKKKNYNKY